MATFLAIHSDKEITLKVGAQNILNNF